MNLIKNYMLNR